LMYGRKNIGQAWEDLWPHMELVNRRGWPHWRAVSASFIWRLVLTG
jgi:hypothetical protein